MTSGQNYLQSSLSSFHYLSGTFQQPVLDPDDEKQPVLPVQSERSKLDQLGGKVNLVPPVVISRPDLLEDSMTLADALAG